MPQLNETAKKIAQGHDILLIEGSTEGDEEIEKIKLEIEDRIKQINQKIVASKQAVADQQASKQETSSFFGKLRGKK